MSSLQTGVFAGPVGSHLGQQSAVPRRRRRPRGAARARGSTPPHHGRIETRLRAIDHPRAMVALWMIGLEDEPERSGEICVVEIFGRDVLGPDRARVGMGIHRVRRPGAASRSGRRRSWPIDVTRAARLRRRAGRPSTSRSRSTASTSRPSGSRPLPDAADARGLRVPGRERSSTRTSSPSTTSAGPAMLRCSPACRCRPCRRGAVVRAALRGAAVHAAARHRERLAARGHAWVYVVEDSERAGRGLLTVIVDDLDAQLAGLAQRGRRPTRSRRWTTASARRRSATRTATYQVRPARLNDEGPAGAGPS